MKIRVSPHSWSGQSQRKRNDINSTTPKRREVTTYLTTAAMFSRSIISPALLLAVIMAAFTSTSAFTTTNAIQSRANVAPASSKTALSQFGRKPSEDLSDIEVRDMTREEMLALNKRNEEVMNRELQAMTGISVLFSIPILYLCWVAFFSD